MQNLSSTTVALGRRRVDKHHVQQEFFSKPGKNIKNRHFCNKNTKIRTIEKQIRCINVNIISNSEHRRIIENVLKHNVLKKTHKYLNK